MSIAKAKKFFIKNILINYAKTRAELKRLKVAKRELREIEKKRPGKLKNPVRRTKLIFSNIKIGFLKRRTAGAMFIVLKVIEIFMQDYMKALQKKKRLVKRIKFGWRLVKVHFGPQRI